MDETYRDNDLFVASTYTLFLLNYIMMILYFVAYADEESLVCYMGIGFFLIMLHAHLNIASRYKMSHQKAFELFYHTPK
jgi:uncharacterized membrane protein